MIMRAFRYRIYLTKSQTRSCERTLEECRWLYNHFIELHRARYQMDGGWITRFDRNLMLPKLKAERPAMREVYSQIFQDVSNRIEFAYQGFFRRVKNGEAPGYPRFRGESRYNSFTYPQANNGSVRFLGNRIHLAKIGTVKIVLHRPIEGVLKSCTVLRTATGKWFVNLCCQCPEPTPLPKAAAHVGIDMGILTFAALSTGEKVENPQYGRKSGKRLAQAKRRWSRATTGTAEYRKRKRIAARVHEKIHNQRHDFAHQTSRRIVNRFDTIVVERLNIEGMASNHKLARSIMDASWGNFVLWLTYKAAWAGRQLVVVPPMCTSRECSACGHRHTLTLAERDFVCPICNLTLDRDHNASLNILRLGLQSLGRDPRNAEHGHRLGAVTEAKRAII